MGRKKVTEEQMLNDQSICTPLVPLRDVVVFPNMVIPLFVGRIDSIRAIETSMNSDKRLLLVAQRDSDVEDPQQDDLYQMGTMSTILQMLRLPDGTVKVLIEGARRASLHRVFFEGEHLWADIDIHHEHLIEDDAKDSDIEITLLRKSVLAHFDQLIRSEKKIPPELLSSLNSISNLGRFVDSVSSHLTVKLQDRQKILEQVNCLERLHQLNEVLAGEVDLLEVEKRVQGRVKKSVELNQRQFYLSEKIKALQQELAETDQSGAPVDEIGQLEGQIESSGMHEEAKNKALSELSKLKMMSPMSAEATVCRNYLDVLVNLPWKKTTRLSKDLAKAQDLLDGAHYGLADVKKRIIGDLGIHIRVKKHHGPILCLVGPPGVGKTSLGQSIAAATGRVFLRISLGGVRDEAEIRGHRRTYIGANPGKLIQKISKGGVVNPLIMLDEIDKMSMDFRGDPASALLEALDHEQNSAFNDHYLEVDYDLSNVMFVATANSMNIPAPLLDRMEVIRIAGYTEDEKLNIAKRFIVPKQKKLTGLKDSEIDFNEASLRHLVRHYTREAGVRGLERKIAAVCRETLHDILTAKTKKKSCKVTPATIEKSLGVQKYRYGVADKINSVGQVTGLAWTEVGGELLVIEAQVVHGKGKSTFTGSLGDVMQESIQAAMTVIRSRCELFGIAPDFFLKNDIHVHMPEGATPKDGPSAGIGMCTAILSAITDIEVKSTVAMTGEITLRGEVLPIGGLKEKLLAAQRGGITQVIIPQDNEKDLTEIPKHIIKSLEVIPVKWIDQVFDLALTSVPYPQKKSSPASKRAAVKKTSKSHRDGANSSGVI